MLCALRDQADTDNCLTFPQVSEIDMFNNLLGDLTTSNTHSADPTQNMAITHSSVPDPVGPRFAHGLPAHADGQPKVQFFVCLLAN